MRLRVLAKDPLTLGQLTPLQLILLRLQAAHLFNPCIGLLDDMKLIEYQSRSSKVLPHALDKGPTHVNRHLGHRLGMPVMSLKLLGKTLPHTGVLPRSSKEHALVHQIRKYRDV